MSIVQSQPSSVNAVSRDTNAPKLIESEFSKLILDYGYNVQLEAAIHCPCSNNNTNSAHPNCKNCYGTGWFFLNKRTTQAVLQGMNANLKYENWTNENIGTVRVTAYYKDKVSIMDRITLLDSITTFSEKVECFQEKSLLLAYTVYPIKEIEYLYVFEDHTKPLIPLTLTIDYTFSGRVITIINKKYKSKTELSIGVRYRHNPQYHIIDLERDIMTQSRKNCSNLEVLQNFPIKATARLAHNVLEQQNNL